MNFSKDNFLGKELVKTFSYTTATQDREAYANVVINGRQYTKYGTLQAVTFVGNLYRVDNKYVLFVGMSKQHPCDTKVNKRLGWEIAAANALDNPFMIIEVNSKFDKFMFNDFVEGYMDNMMDLQFVKTREEILAEGKNPNDYCR